MRPVLANASCEEIFEKGGIENGIYTIQPSLDLDPFPVECEFGEDGHVKTILNHKQSRIQYFFSILKSFFDYELEILLILMSVESKWLYFNTK